MTALTAHPLLIRLAHELLRKAERSQGERTVSLSLDAAMLPELHHADTPDALRHLALLLEQLSQTGWVSLRLSKAQAFQTLADRRPMLVLHDAAELARWSGFSPQAPPWNRHLVQALRSPGMLQVPYATALLDYLLRNPLPWFAHQAPAACARTLNALAAACAADQVLYLRELSALHFDGHSKVLDAREELLRLLGAADGQFIEAPVQLLVSLPPEANGSPPFDEVLFVENLVSFERMVQRRHAAWARIALLYASGYRGTARRLRTPEGSSLYWRDGGHPEGATAFTRWLYDRAALAATPNALPVSFYGDLDFSGMHILAQLRQSFPDCRAWPAGYEVLLGQLQAGLGHAAAIAGKAGQIDPGRTGCAFADEHLLPALRQSTHCADQELWPGCLGPDTETRVPNRS